MHLRTCSPWRGAMLVATATVGVACAATTPANTAGAPASAAPGEPTACAADLCLVPGEVLVGDAFVASYARVYPAAQSAPPNPAGEATFTLARDGSTTISRVWYATRPAAPDDLVVGAMIAGVEAVDPDGIHRAPETRREAATSPWFVARIVSLAPLAQGHVVVSGGYRVAVGAARLVENDTPPKVITGGAEDAHFVTPGHVFIGDAPLPTGGGYQYVRLALPVDGAPAAAGGAEHFTTSTGELVRGPHAWPSRAASAADSKVGAHVVVFDAVDGNAVYRAPESRPEALRGVWWSGRITDASQASTGVVTVAEKYRVKTSALRVLSP